MNVRLFAGYSTLESRDDGAIDGAGREGVYDFDARLLRRFRYLVADAEPRLVGSTPDGAHHWRGVLVVRSPSADADVTGPALPQDAIELRIDRAVHRGLVDRLALTNHAAAGASVRFALELEPDFADTMEVDGRREQVGDCVRSTEPGAATWRYVASRDDRRVERGVRVAIAGLDVEQDERGFGTTISLAPHETVEFTVTVESLVAGRWRTPEPAAQDAWLKRWTEVRARIDSPGSAACAAAERAAADLGALRNDDLFDTSSDRAWFPNAGVPVFTGFFGRDTLTAAWQAALLGPEMLRGAIETAAATQATVDDPWRDAEPGKLVHEIRAGPLSELDIVPQSGYYGSQTTGAIFVLALSEYWHWTADTRFVRRHLPTAHRVFDWVTRFGDRDGDGFVEYVRRSARGLKNQGWKDSNEAIRYPDGRLVENPIATVEEQAFHALALERMAELLVATGDEGGGEAFVERARVLRRRWHEAFWLAEDGYYALALDPAKQPVASVASNPGHALGAGIVPVEHARRVAERLLARDLFTGWGVRTLSADHPSYNPYAYHLGTVWPVEQATFALGCKRYGFDDLVDRLVSGMLGAAGACPTGRLPELLAGLPRAPLDGPVLYPAANSPQAWSASATIQLLQASLGIYPFAPLGALLLVRPRLPADIPRVTISNLRVGRARVSLAFTREADGSARHEIVERHGRLVVLVAPPPQAEPVGWLERLSDAALRVGPGRRLRAARIALGFAAE